MVKRLEDIPVRPGWRVGGSRIARRERVARRERRMAVLKGPSSRPEKKTLLGFLCFLPAFEGWFRLLGGREEGEVKGNPTAKKPASKRPAMEEMFTTRVVVRKVILCE